MPNRRLLPCPWDRVRRSLLAVLVLLLLTSCSPKPVAPALKDEPVYQNDREGVRFLVPDGWTQFAKGDIPPGKLDKERRLVEYKRKTFGKGAGLIVTVVDLEPTADLAAYLAGPAFGAEKWQLKGKPEAIEINRVAAQRFTFVSRIQKEEMVREVVAFRRGERVYLFTGLFASDDARARDQVRRAVGSTVWKS